MRPAELPLTGGFDMGPLFAPPAKRRAPKPRMQSTYRDHVVRSRTPAWADRRAIAEVFKQARRITQLTGVRHSVDHIVPMNNPLVCGLHCEANLSVLPLSDNMRKSNCEWPDMWEVQDDFLSPVTASCHP